MSAPIENILSRLDKVRQRQAGQWSARCPAHADKGPSLSVRETPEGAVLLHCFAGCTTTDVVGAMGLELNDLFPPNERPANAPKRTARAIAPSQALEILARESTLVAVVASTLAKGQALTEADRQRLIQAVGRINEINNEVRAA